MRIVIDLQGAQAASAQRGIGRYSIGLSQSLLRNRGNHEILVALNGLLPDAIEPIRAALNGLISQQDIRVWESVAPLEAIEPGNRWRIHTAERIREAFLARLNPDVVLVSSLFEGLHQNAVTSFESSPAGYATAVVLYDLIPYIHRKPYLENPLVEQWYLEKIEVLKQADLLLAISDSARSEAIHHLGLPEERVMSISAAADERFEVLRLRPDEESEVRARYNLFRSYVLSVGGYDFRKNTEGLIRAYAQLPERIRRSHQLAIAGAIEPVHRSNLERLVKQRGLTSDEVVFAGYVPDADLPALYNLCKVVALPSWHEGFGLPAIEAMRCGAAVIGANASSLPEVIGNPDALFDPHSDASIAAKLAQTLEDEPFRRALQRHGMEHQRNFTWDRCATLALGALEAVCPTRKPTPPSFDHSLGALIQSIASIDSSSPDDRDWYAVAAAIDRSFPSPTRTPQLFIDVSELCQRDARSGIQRVVRNILRELLAKPPEGFSVEPVFATADCAGYRYARAFTQRFLDQTGETQDDPMEAHAGDIFLGLDLQSDVVRVQTEFLRRLRRRAVRVHFVVYDLIPVLMPQCFPPGADRGHAEWLSTIAEFDGALCISNSVAEELDAWLKVNGPPRLRPFDIRAFHLGADFDEPESVGTLSRDRTIQLESLADGITFLMVGTVEPRKHHAQALDAFELLWAEGQPVNLVIVGKRGWMVDEVSARLRNHTQAGKRLLWFDTADDALLQYVYETAACLLAASSAEGFGLPLVEAAHAGLPILARSIPVFREIAGDSAYYFEGERPYNLAEAIRAWLQLHSQGREPGSSGVRVWTWRESADSLLEGLGLAPIESSQPVQERISASEA